MRGVIYVDHRGGYIDNVPSTFTRMNVDPGDHYFSNLAGGRQVPERPAGESQKWGVRPGQQPERQQLQPRGDRHEPGRLHRHTRLRALGLSTAIGTC